MAGSSPRPEPIEPPYTTHVFPMVIHAPALLLETPIFAMPRPASTNPKAIVFFPQLKVEGLLNTRRRMSDRSLFTHISTLEGAHALLARAQAARSRAPALQHLWPCPCSAASPGRSCSRSSRCFGPAPPAFSHRANIQELIVIKHGLENADVGWSGF